VKLLPKGAAPLPAVTLMLCCGLLLAASTGFPAGSCTQAMGNLRGAGQLTKENGSMADGGSFRHDSTSDHLLSWQEAVVHLDT